MQIFYVSSSPVLAAQMLADKHVIKQVLESTQLLSTALNEQGFCSPYKPTHKHHPCTKWVLQSEHNYQWLYEHYLALCAEYTRRYGKIHKCKQYATELKGLGNSLLHTTPALAMPDQYKTECPVQSYRSYYIAEKSSFAKWKLNNTPSWFTLLNTK